MKQLVRMIAAKWVEGLPKVVEGEFTRDEIWDYNVQGYNIYYLPNPPNEYIPGRTVDGSQITKFKYVLVDMDLKDGKWPSKEAFYEAIENIDFLVPNIIVDSGNGVHAYWEVHDLDAMSYLRLSRRMMRLLNTDEAVGQIYQLLRLPDTVNMKEKDHPKLCEAIIEVSGAYSAETLDNFLPPITQADEAYCQQHYNKTYKLQEDRKVELKIPVKFMKLLESSKEAKDIWLGNVDDRSKADFRLAHIMYASGFTKDEATSVLANSSKATSRAPAHQISYATNIVDKIFEELPPIDDATELSHSVRNLLSRGDDETLKGTRIWGPKWFDNTYHGLRLGHVVGLVAGVGVGKTTISLNLFKGFIELNPQWHHMFISLEQPASEIASRLKKMFAGNEASYDKIHIMDNENADGSKRDLSLHDIQAYILDFQKRKNIKIACVVLDHIGILRMVTKNGENQGLMDVCRELKGFARATNTLFVVQSQSTREKAGDGDIELFKGAAYGTQHFESYMDFLAVAWAPLKRCYDDPACPTVTAYKFVKVRFKTIGKDKIIEDQPYRLYYNGDTELLQDMTQEQEQSFDFFAKKCVSIRNKDKKKDLVSYKSVRWEDMPDDGKSSSNSNSS